LDHPPYIPDLAPSDFHLFLHLKKNLAGKKFDDADEVQEEVMMCPPLYVMSILE
jgi:histone-lysine N-methyltransferase SETMAR